MTHDAFSDKLRETEAMEKLVRQNRYLTLENHRLKDLVDRMTLPSTYQDGVRDCINIVEQQLTVSNMLEVFKRSLLRDLEKLNNA